MSQKPVIQSLVPGGKPVELVDYYTELDWHYPNCKPETKHWFVKNVRPDWRIFDVGASVGVYSVLFSRLATQGSVIAFEPTATVEMLARNLAHNGCTNVQVEAIALGSKTGAVEDGIYRIWGDDPERRVYPFYRLDDYVRNNGIDRLDCIKIDVDSFDFEVLLGARETLRTLKPVVVVELNHALSRRNQSNVKALEWLREQGIEEVLSLDGDNFVITPGRPVQATYPVGRAIQIAFADTRDLPSPVDEGEIRVLKTYDPHTSGVLHGDTKTRVLEGGSVLQITTPDIQWGYATAFPIDDIPQAAADLRVLLDIEVVSGRVGLGCLGKDGQYIGPERLLGPGRRRSVLMPVTDAARLDVVMIRNVAEEARSCLRVYGVKLGVLVGERAPETELSADTLALRVHEALASETEVQAFAAPLQSGKVDVVDYSALNAALGFGEPFVQAPGAGETALAFWKMERDDAPILQYVYRNLKPRRHLEIGTWEGFGVVACASACDAEIWTINLPEGERTETGELLYKQEGSDGSVQTDSGDFIGHLYREAGFADRVHQVLCDSTQWRHEGVGDGFFDTALIDGGHTYEVVTADTDMVIPLVRSGGIVMWHDFCPEEEALQAHVAPRGVVEAVARNLDRWQFQFAKLIWVRPSWVLIGVRK